METLTEISFKLDNIKSTLKSEFIGLDEIIDQFIQAVTPWCTMAESQRRPLVVNLWGMTGTGKTSLVNRFVELWDKDQSIIPFNLGSRNNSREILDSMQNMISLSEKPVIFIFDEFQHAKTLDNGLKELENPMDRIIWQLMDSGIFSYAKYWPDDDDLRELASGLELCLERGVKVVNGKIVEGMETYLNIMGQNDERYKSSTEMEDKNFLSHSDLRMLYDHVKAHFPFKAILRDFIFRLDGQEILEFVKKTEKEACLTKKLDFSKALVFVIGNLDEAYEMSDMVSADHDPDLLHEASKRITFSNVKEALKERFRMEEIARLGNIHLIYPAMSSKVYREFIGKELEVIRDRFKHTFRCHLSFSENVIDMLFEEGVFPSQGFRPLRSSIRYIMESSLVEMLQSTYFEFGEKLFADVKKDDMLLIHQGQAISRKTLHLPVREAKRKKMSPQMMAVTAVHEAGHALVYSILTGRLPQMVTIASSDFNTGGFVEGNFSQELESHDHLIRDVAIRLAGKKAEEIVFGQDNITTGCEMDLKTASRRLLQAYRSGAFNRQDIAFEPKTHGSGKLLVESSESRLWVSENLEKASALADRLLKENKKAFKAIIDTLLDKKYVSAQSLSDELYLKGIDVAYLLHSFPEVMDFHLKLQSFMKD